MAGPESQMPTTSLFLSVVPSVIILMKDVDWVVKTISYCLTKLQQPLLLEVLNMFGINCHGLPIIRPSPGINLMKIIFCFGILWDALGKLVKLLKAETRVIDESVQQQTDIQEGSIRTTSSPVLIFGHTLLSTNISILLLSSNLLFHRKYYNYHIVLIQLITYGALLNGSTKVLLYSVGVRLKYARFKMC